ncbi:MAG: hypothetical protein WC121_05930 [Candidatus Kapaibacterium sp.]
MRKLSYILLLAAILPFVGCENALGPQYDETLQVRSETKWRVSTIDDHKISKVSYKVFNSRGDIISKVEYNQNGKLQSTSEYSYKDGNSSEQEIKFSNGDTIGILLHQYVLENGKIVSKKTTNKSGEVLDNEQLKYDINGNITEIVRCEGVDGCDDRTKYDNQYVDGNLTVRYTFESDGSVAQKDSIVYITNDNYFEKITSDNKGNVFFITGYAIDKDGRIKSEIIKNSSGSIVEKFIYEYTYFE